MFFELFKGFILESKSCLPIPQFSGSYCKMPIKYYVIFSTYLVLIKIVIRWFQN